MTLKKCSSGPQEIEFGFKLKVHDLGQDADGDPIPSAPSNGSARASRALRPNCPFAAAGCEGSYAKGRHGIGHPC